MMFARPLNHRTLAHHAQRMSVPTYDRSALTRGVVHIGVGSFHRSHQALYFDELAQRRISSGWGVVGVGLRSPEMNEVLGQQDGLYTVVSRGNDGDEARVVGAIVDCLFAPEEGAAVLRALAAERTRLVTLTITAGGYKVDLETGAFAAEDPEIVADLENPSEPATAVGLLVEALERRRRLGRPPFTVLSCDNLPGNGLVVRTAVLAFAKLRDRRLAEWIDEHVTFPCSMVDRITPRTTLDDRQWVQDTFGVADRWPVITEQFSQWIVEDSFCNGRPPLDAVGVQFVDDVSPYSTTKTRMLNATHSALGYLGSLAGHERTHEAMEDPVFGTYVERLMGEDIAPLLPPSAIDLDAYGETLRERFGNAAISDPLSRLCRNGSSKVPGHILASIREARAMGRPHPLLTLAVAGWCRYLRGVDEDGVTFELDDPDGERLQALALAGGSDPRPLLSDQATFGTLGACPIFTGQIRRDLRALDTFGAAAVVAQRAASDAPVANA